MSTVKLYSGTVVEANDVCDRCGEPVFIPAEAVRCEWGCCYREVPNDRYSHECKVCSVETHRYSLAQLVLMAETKTPYFPPRTLGQDRNSEEMLQAWQKWDVAHKQWRAKV